MNFKLGKCEKHGRNQLFGASPGSEFYVCIRCCVDFFTGHHLRQFIREATNVVESKTLLPEVGYAPRPASASGPRSSDKDSGK